MKRKIVKKTSKIVKRAKPKTQVHVTITRKVFGKAPEKYSFNLGDGRKLQSVYELIDELETMADDTFRNYVTDTENHFANWIQDVFSEKALADELRHVKDRIDTQRAILKHFVRELTKQNAKRR